MSLFEWCWAPERRSSRVDQALPVIPSEIYVDVIDLLVPPAMLDLAPYQLKILCNLSRVCRLFANICLPRMYESVELSGLPSRHHDPKELLGSVLCTQIAENQPLALALAQTVKACKADSWGDMLYANSRCISAISHMKNIRKFEFSYCDINAQHWDIIVALPSLEDLSFDACKFMQGPASTEPKKNPKLKLSRLRVVECTGNQQLPFAAIDLDCLRTLAMNLGAIEKEDWLRESAVTELDLCDSFQADIPPANVVLLKAPRSLEVLRISVDETPAYDIMNIVEDLLDSMIQDPAWKDLSSLSSLTLRVMDGVLDMDDPELDLSMGNSDILSQLKLILHDKLGPFATLSNLKHVEFLENVFRLVDGEWVKCLM